MSNSKQIEAYLSRAMQYCSKSEHCSFEVKQKLEQWDAPKEIYDQIISILINDRFIDEQRYANAFVNDKYRFNKWGRKKIAYSLAQKQISDKIIHAAMLIIKKTEYENIALELMQKKTNKTNAKTSYQLKQKVFMYMYSRGFETSLLSSLWEDNDFGE